MAALAVMIPSSFKANQVRVSPSSKPAYLSYEKASYAPDFITFALTFLASTKEASSFTDQELITATTAIAFVINKASQVKELPLQAVLATQAKVVEFAKVARQAGVVKEEKVNMAMASYFRIQVTQKSSLLKPLHLTI